MFILRRSLAPIALGATLLALSLAATPARAPKPSHFAANGIRTYYELRGTGTPLLLIHGGAGNGMQFEKQVTEFEKSHRLIIPDCCNQGRTTCRAGALTYHAMAEDMIALLDHLKIRRVDIMGWSDGGNIGLDLAMHHPDRVNHLVTFGANFSPAGLQDADRIWAATATPESLGSGMREGWMKLSPEPERFDEAMNGVLKMWRTLPDWTVSDLGRIRAKVMVCAGEHDVIRLEHTGALSRAIPGAQMWIVPGASHSAMLERPDLVNPRVLEFLAH